MQRRILSAAVGVFLVGGALSHAYASPEGGARYIVVLKGSAQAPGAVATEHATEEGAEIGYVYRSAIKGYAATIPDRALDDVLSDPRVDYVTPDPIVKAVDLPTSQTTPAGVRRTFAPDNTNISIDGTDDKRVDADIAIIDSGIDPNHPDLNVVGGYNCQSGTTFADGYGHGTHVAGNAAAIDNGIGSVGVAPGARLWSIRVLDDTGAGSWSSVICGIDWLTAQRNHDQSAKIEVANMSLIGPGTDGPCSSSSLHQAICNSVAAGITYTAAAGNASTDAAHAVPASYDQVITVSALADFDGLPGGGATPTCLNDVDDTFANFSNYGADIDVIAPGACIYSTAKGGSYGMMSGTSVAAPHVAGAAALYKERNPQATPSQVRDGLRAAGSGNWDNQDDRDGIREPLLDVHDGGIFGGVTPPIAKDAAPPTDVEVSGPAFSTGFSSIRSFVVGWSAADASGIASYDVSYRVASSTTDFGAQRTWQRSVNSTAATFPGSPGSTYCFSVRASDTAGNISAWSYEKCTAIPLDDRSLSPATSTVGETRSVTNRRWSRVLGRSASDYYLASYSHSSQEGSSLAKTGLQAKRLSVVATRCPTCGSIQVLWNGVVVKEESLHAPTTLTQQWIDVASFSGVESGTLTIKVSSSGRSVYIDGLGASRV